jgi:RHS repeat-associated protein
LDSLSRRPRCAQQEAIMPRRPLFWKKSKPANTPIKPKKYLPDIEQLEIRQMLSITSAFQRVTDPGQVSGLTFGTATVFPNTGSFRLSSQLDFDQSPGTSVGRNPALVYDSSQVAPRPIIEAVLTTTAGLGLPTSIQATLTFNGTAQSTVTFSTSGHSAGDTYIIDTQAASAVTSTGAYSWSLSIQTFYSGSSPIDTASGTAYAVVSNTFAPGWSIAGVDQLVTVSGGVMYVYGSGGFRVFTGSGPSYTSPANDFGTLVKNVGGDYTYTAKDQTKFNFNSSGQMTSVVDTHNVTATYLYSAGTLSEVDAPDGGVTLIKHKTNWTITEPGTRAETVFITVSGVTIDGITQPNTTSRSFTYSGNFITSDSYSPQLATFTYDGTTGLLSSVDRGAGTTLSLAPAASYGLATSPSKNSPTVATATDALSQVTTYALDSQGRGTKLTTPDGGVTTYALDSAGHVTVLTDPMNRVTSYSYGASTDNLTQVTYSDSSTQQYAYDSTYNKVTQSTDTRSNITTYTLDSSNGDVTRVKDALGNVTTMTYSTGLLQTTKDALGHVTSFQYDGSRRLSDTIDALNHRTTFAYDGSGNLTTVKDALGRVTTTTYDAMNNLVQKIDPTGAIATFTYNADGSVSTQVDANVNFTGFVYDSAGHQTVASKGKVGLPAVEVTTMTYGTGGYNTSTTDGNGNTTSYTFDSMGRVKTVTSPAGGVTTSVYDLDGELVSVTDPLNHTTTYSYNNRGRQTSVQDPLNQIVTTTYDTQGNKTVVQDARTNLTTFSYDALNRLTQIKDALNGLTSMVFDAVGSQIAAINALAARTSFGYDAANRRTSVTDALNHTTTLTLDAVGNTTSVTDPAGDVTTYGFDGMNRQTSVQDPDGGIATTVYDGVGNVARTIDPLNKTTTFGYDSVNRLTSTVDANGGITTRTYDSIGNLRTLKDQVNNVTTFTYDTSNRLTSQTDPLGHTGTMAYDLANRLTSKTDAVGNVISYGYDAANRELGETWKVSGSTTNVVTYTYDNNGNQLTALDSKGTYTMAFDALDRVTVTNEPFGVTLTATYDAIGERTQVQDSFSGTTTYVFDAVGNLTSEKFGGPGQTPLRMDQAYDPRNLVTTITRYSDLAGTTKIGSTANAYDPAGRLTHHQDLNGGGTNIANYTYAYDTVGRITTEKLNGASPITYTYDNIGQLTNDGTTAYTYDAAGNRTMAGYSTGTGNQITGQGAWSYGYDLNGNQTTKTQGPSFDTWTYQFDANNRLTSVQDRATAGGTLLSAVTYVYDVKGNRIEEDTWSSGGGNTVTRFAYDGQNAFVDLNSSNGLVTRRLYQDGVDTLFARISAAGTAAWYLTDRLGSVRGMVDASGTPQATIAYDGFGNVTSNSNSGFTDRYLFTARELDSATGLQYNRARYYDATIGKWTQRDPIGFQAGDANLYRYAANAPQRNTDSSGLEKELAPDTGPFVKSPKLIYWADTWGYYGEDGKWHETRPASGLVPDNKTMIMAASLYWWFFGAMVPDPGSGPPGGSGGPDLGGGGGPDLGGGGGPDLGSNGGAQAPGAGPSYGIDVNDLTPTNTVANHIPSRPYIESPHTIQNIIDSGPPVPDPGGVPDALRWDADGSFNLREGTYELVIDPAMKKILHFLFKGN